MKNLVYKVGMVWIAGMAIIACKKMRTMEDPRQGLGLDQVLLVSFEDENNEILADGSDRMYVYANLDSTNVSPNIDVTYTTEQGTFIGGDVATNGKSITVRADGFRSKVILKSDNIVNERVGLSVSVGAYTQYIDAAFNRSYPQQVLNTANKLTMAPNLSDKVLIDVNLIKSTGLVSEDTRVDFEVINLEGTPEVFIQPLFWSSTHQQASMITTTLDTGKVAIVPYVFDGVNYIRSIDTMVVRIEN